MKEDIERSVYVSHFTHTTVLAASMALGGVVKPTQIARAILTPDEYTGKDKDDRALWVRLYGSSVVCRLLDQLAARSKVIKMSRGEYKVKGVVETK